MNKLVNFQRLINKLANSINFFYIELWDQIEFHQHWTVLLAKWWMKDILNNLLSVFLILSDKLLQEFLCSLCCSLVLIQHLKSKELLLNIIFQVQIRNLQIFLWVKVNKNLQKMLYSMLLKKDIGLCYRIYI